MERKKQSEFKAPTLGMISSALGTNEILALLLSRGFKYYHFEEQSTFNLIQDGAFNQLISRADYHGTRDRICLQEIVGKDEECWGVVLLDASKGSQRPICAVTKVSLSCNPYGTIEVM